VHFFKLVSIVFMRFYISLELDESYTPTRLSVWAGTGFHDLQRVCDMGLVDPTGWVAVEMGKVGGIGGFKEEELAEMDEESEEEAGGMEDGDTVDVRKAAERAKRREKRRASVKNGTLRCMMLQVRITENHQNGKDTHLRGLQIYAKDENAKGRRKMVEQRPRRRSVGGTRAAVRSVLGVREADWMGEPELR